MPHRVWRHDASYHRFKLEMWWCNHFYVDFDRQNIVERDDPANLRFCDCPWCKAHPDLAAQPEF